MRPIHIVELDKARPALVLTRVIALDWLHNVTIAPITSTIRGIATEVHVGRLNGLDHESVISCDNITTVPSSAVGLQVGFFFDHDETALVDAIHAAFGFPA